jgi:ACR3 family arsenite transporter
MYEIMNNLRERLRNESLRLYEDLEYTFNAHFVVAKKLGNLNLWLGVFSIILSVEAGCLALTRLVPYFEVFAGISGFAAATFTALLVFLKPTDRHERYVRYGNKYRNLREDVRRFFEIDFYTEKPDNELKVLLDALLSKKKRLDGNSPLLPDGALRKAKKRIELEKPKYEREVKVIPENKLSVFEKYLTLWVLLCIGAGIVLGKAAPEFAVTLDSLAVNEVSIPIAVCLFFMMYPIMVKIDFAEVIKAGKTPKPVILTLVINWCISPFMMYVIATFFLGYIFKDFLPGTEIIKDGSTVELYRSYISGAILLGIAPCTAMVLMWGYLARGNDGLTLVMVAINSLTMLVLYAPLGGFWLKVNKMPIPWETIALSVLIYVALPLVAGYFSRKWIIKTKGLVWFQEKFLHFLTPVSITALLATLVLLFSFKGDVIIAQKQVILFIAIPLFIHTSLIFSIGYVLAKFLRLGYRDAAPAAMIGASNHFEVAIATSTMLFGLSSGASLATVVGVLIEVPVMLMLVKICLKTQNWFR